VFSNGVVVLTALACLLIAVFDADLTRLIQLYVVGVFTSFTLSQTGMVRHWLKEKQKGPSAARGWRRSIVINGIGATATFVVLCVVTYTKFKHGAWIVIAAMPFIVMMFLAIHRHYEAVLRELRRGRSRAGEVDVNRIVLLVLELDVATAEAVGAIRSIRPTEWRVVYPSNEGVGNSWTGMRSVAFNMKSCQMRAGIVPPYTAEYPSTFSRGISPFGYPIHTQVTSRGT